MKYQKCALLLKRHAFFSAISIVSSLFLLSAAIASQKDPFYMPLALDPWNEKESKFEELLRIEDDLYHFSTQKSEISRTIELSRLERDSLTRELSSSGFSIQKIEKDISTLEKRLLEFEREESVRRNYVVKKNNLYVEIIAAIQKIGLNPPPAMLVSPHDSINTVRSVIILDQLLPNIRAEAKILVENLDRLVVLRKTITNDRAKLALELSTLSNMRSKISKLVEDRKNLEANSAQKFAVLQNKVLQLAQQSESLKDLIAKLEADINAANATAKLKHGASGGVGGPELNLGLKESKDTLNDFSTNQNKLSKLNFDAQRGKIAFPVSGTILRDYNSVDQMGMPSKGVLLATREAAQVISPVSGSVLFAGNFRSYGQMIIINLGMGYHMLIAGMEKINIVTGQFIELGEPIGEMGVSATTTMVALSASSFDTAAPILYTELRKDGQIIDPSPWLVSTQEQKERE